MRSSRLFHIVYRLLQDGRATAPQLARQLEVSVRTIYRDIEALCEAGMPIVTEQGQGGGVRLMDGFVLNKAMMDESEQEQLLMAVKSLSAATGEPQDELISKLGALFQRPQTDWLEVDLSRWGQPGQHDERFDLIKTAILERRVLRFCYAGASGMKHRAIRPARLCFKASAWYVQGVCMAQDAYRTFKVSRMSALALTDEHFDALPPMPPIEQAPAAPWPAVELRFAKEAAFRVYDEFDGESIQAEPSGALRVTTHMPLADGWLYGYLLSFGGQAEVVSPPEVRHELARRAQLTARRYEKFLPPDLNLSQDVRFDAVYCTHPHEGEDDIQEVYEMEQKFCQSCGMPLGDVEGQYGTEKDGSHNHDYCTYCYQNGAFTRDCSMEEMIDYCVPYMVQGNPGMTEEKARESMRQFFPMLKRWANA